MHFHAVNNHQGCWVCAWPCCHSRCRVDNVCTCHCTLSIRILSTQTVTSMVRSLTTEAAKTLVQAFISCRLDYCNSLLYGVTENVIRRVQSLQNAAARLITGARHRDHITPVLCQLHWLPVRRRVEFKLACLVRQALCGQMPTYTWLMISISSPKATDDPFGLPLITCAVPRTHNSFGDRSFGAAGPRIWNSLPCGLRTLDITQF